MKAYIFDPLWDSLITPELQSKLKSADLEVIVTKEIASLSQSQALNGGGRTQDTLLKSRLR